MCISNQQEPGEKKNMFNKILLGTIRRDVTTRATGTTVVTPRFSDTLTLVQPRGADSAQHRRGRTKNFPIDTSQMQKNLFS